MTILYYFKPPQWIPDVEKIYEETASKVRDKVRKKRKRRVIQDRIEISENLLEQSWRDDEEAIILSLMIDGLL